METGGAQCLDYSGSSIRSSLSATTLGPVVVPVELVSDGAGPCEAGSEPERVARTQVDHAFGAAVIPDRELHLVLVVSRSPLPHGGPVVRAVQVRPDDLDSEGDCCNFG